MSGGFLQLVARGIQDIYINGSPQVTPFKIIYRRHTNFSMEDIKLTFNNETNFGCGATCRLKHFGDLIHKLYLLIDIPKINIKYIPLTKNILQKLLAEYNIQWKYTGSGSDIATEEDIIEVTNLINDKENEYSQQISLFTTIKNIIQANTPDSFSGSSGREYATWLFQKIIAGAFGSKYLLEYDYLNAYRLDAPSQLSPPTFYAKYYTSINADSGGGTLTGIPVGNATITNGTLDLTGRTLSYVKYSGSGNANFTQNGTIRFLYIPNYNNRPEFDTTMFSIVGNTSTNYIQLTHTDLGEIKLETDIPSITVSSPWICSAGVQYVIEVDCNFSGTTRVFIDGRIILTSTTTGIRNTSNCFLYVGTDVTKSVNSNFKIKNFTIFNYVENTTVYIPEPPILLHNSDIIHNLLYTTYRDGNKQAGIQGAILQPSGDLEDFSDSILFYHYIDSNPYIVTSEVFGSSMRSLFDRYLEQIYGTVEYTGTAAYKIYDNYFYSNPQIISSVADYISTKQEVLDYISLNIQKNIQQMYNIFKTLGMKKYTVPFASPSTSDNHFRFASYKLYPYIGTDTFGTTQSFITITSESPLFSDNFGVNIRLPTDSNSTVTHFYGEYVNDNLNEFYSNLKDIYNSQITDDYFNDVTLWRRNSSDTRLLLTNYQTGLSPADVTIFKNTYLMNYIPLVVKDDLNSLIGNFINNTTFGDLGITNPSPWTLTTKISTAYPSFATHVHTQLSSLNTLFSTALNYLKTLSTGDIDLLRKINLNYKNADDMILVSLLKPEPYFNVSGSFYSPISYIIYQFTQYLIITPNYTGNGDGSPLYLNQVLPKVVGSVSTTGGFGFLINSFNDVVDIDLPTYTEYNANNYNLIFNSGIDFTTQFPASQSYAMYSNAISSIWNSYVTSFITDFNVFFGKITNPAYILDELGDPFDLIMYIIYLFLFPVTQSFYGADISLIPDILDLFTEVSSEFQAEYDRYLRYKNFLTMRNIVVNKLFYYFSTFNEIHTFLSGVMSDPSNIYNKDNSGNYIWSELNTNFVTPTYNWFNVITFNAMNIISDSLVNTTFTVSPSIQFETYILSALNPYNSTTQPHLYTWFNTYVSSLTLVQRLFYKTEYENLIPNSINSKYLYNDITNIVSVPSDPLKVTYNNFEHETDVEQYLSDYLFGKLMQIITINFVKYTKQSTYDELLSYVTGKITYYQNLLDQLQGSTENQGLLDIILNMYNRSDAKFAWIKELGHYLVKEVSTEIGGQLMDIHTGEWLHLWHNMTKKNDQERAYQLFIGDIPELYTFNKTTKQGITLKIPLQFWFCRHVTESIPLIALANTKALVRIKLKNLNEVAYWDKDTEFVTKPKIKCKLLAQYIFVEPSERKLLAESKHEHLIEQIQYNGDVTIDATEMTSGKNEINTKIGINNPCKELVWVFQSKDKIDGSLPNGELQPNKYTYTLNTSSTSETILGSINFKTQIQAFSAMGNKKAQFYNREPFISEGIEYIKKEIAPFTDIKIQFNGRDRENEQSSSIYNYVYPWSRHTSSVNEGTYIYSFSFNPEQLQPSGTANLNKIDDLSIFVNPETAIINDYLSGKYSNNKFTFRWGIYGVTYNILRYMSGLCGLAFFSPNK